MYNTYKKLIQDFNTENKPNLKELLDRDIIVTKNNPANKILLAGINPSFDKINTFIDFSFADSDEKIGYWRRYKNMFASHINEVAYLDLFPYKYSNQNEFEKLIKENIEFMAETLRITQNEIERLAPKLIIIANKRSLAFWGANNDCVWMGYQFEDIKENLLPDKEITIKKIVGMRNDSKQLLPLNKTNLKGCYIIFYGLYDERHIKKHPKKILTRNDIDTLYNHIF